MIILDTHTLLCWTDSPQKLSKKARKIIDEEKLKEDNILVSSISTLEIYRLVKKGDLELNTHVDRWMEKIENLPSVRFVPVDNKIASSSVNLPDFSHKDPADRIIIATAREYGATLVTSDKRILLYPHVESLW